MRATTAWSAAIVAAVSMACRGQYQKIVPPDTGNNDRFGFSMAVSGDRLLVGASNSDNVELFDGSAFVFERVGGVWEQVARMTASDPERYDMLGWSAALDGDTAVVGARMQGPFMYGKAYVFRETPDGWSQMAKLLPSDGRPGFGCSAAISGGRAVIGSDWDSGRGSVYVFEEYAGEWIETAILQPDTSGSFDCFGWSVSLQGDRLVVGAPYWPSNGSPPGAAFVFEYADGHWSQTARLTASLGSTYHQFGTSLSLDGDRVLVGAPRANGNKGAAYVFDRTDGGWVEAPRLVAPDGEWSDQFGYAVAISDDLALVGAWEDAVQWDGQGSAYVFRREPTGEWSLVSKLTAIDGAEADRFGNAVAIGDGRMFVGAYGDESGSVYTSSAPYDRTADVNGDGDVNSLDVLAFLNAWAGADEMGDWDWNWRINTLDVLRFLNDWAAQQ